MSGPVVLVMYVFEFSVEILFLSPLVTFLEQCVRAYFDFAGWTT